MARRITVPTTDALFASTRPLAGVERGPTSARPATPRRARRAGTRLRTRIEAVEAGIREVPIDSLIDLRDALEVMLEGDPDALRSAAVEQLLDRVLPG